MDSLESAGLYFATPRSEFRMKSIRARTWGEFKFCAFISSSAWVVLSLATKQTESLFELRNILGGKPPALQSQLVRAQHYHRPWGGGFGIGEDILVHHRVSAKKAVGPNTRELMDAAERAYRGVVTDLNVTCQRSAVRHDDVIAQPAIMRHMNIGHQQIMVADARGTPFRCTAMHGDEFPKGIPVPNFESSLLSLIFHILRIETDRGIGEKPIFLARSGRSLDHDVRHHLAAFAQFNIFANNAVRANRH